ncbi:restriction endonuclease subunit S [Marinilabilia salmonicolor]|uniref:restriction endonuclease subunit S n=1 Tax=Marinilabilia salmonicolor TaxID=989 RepID=UPI00029A48CD|nr:restriction endonuclease subunit S [Marinilabilia salmonicolor]
MSINVISLADTTSFIVDNRGKTVPTADTGIPLIKTNCVTNNQLFPRIDGAFFVSQEIFDSWFRAHPIPGDLILTLKGSQNGAVCLVPDPVGFVIAQDMVALRINKEVINPYYLLASLRTRELQHQIKTLDVSGVIPHLKKTDFDKLILPYPKREIQDYIGNLYYNLSIKIDLLRQQNRTLEELAQTLFKRWFVEFEFPCLPSGYRPQGQVNLEEIAKVCTYSRVGGAPAPDGQSWFVYVLLCEDGSFYKGMTNDLYRRFYEHYTGEGAKHTKIHKPVKIIHWEQFNTQDETRAREEELKTGFGRTWLQREYDKLQKFGHTTSDGLPAHQTKLVPAGKMVESELGEIPEGWHISRLQDITALVSRGISPKYMNEGGICVLNQRCIRNKSIDFSLGRRHNNELKNAKSKFIKPFDVLVNSTGVGTLGRTAVVKRIEEEPTTVDSHVSIIRANEERINKFFLSYLITGKEREIEHMAEGSTGQTELSRAKLNEMEVLIPSKLLQNKFGEISFFSSQKINSNEQEIQILTQLRDTLLPKLMSGEVRVKV